MFYYQENSSAKERYENALCRFYEKIENHNRLKDE